MYRRASSANALVSRAARPYRQCRARWHPSSGAAPVTVMVSSACQGEPRGPTITFSLSSKIPRDTDELAPRRSSRRPCRCRHQPGFTLVVILTLALGLGANTAVFTLVDALMLRSLPVERPEELYRLGDTNNCCVNSGLQTSWSLYSYRPVRTPPRQRAGVCRAGGVSGEHVQRSACAGAAPACPNRCPRSSSPPTTSGCLA